MEVRTTTTRMLVIVFAGVVLLGVAPTASAEDVDECVVGEDSPLSGTAEVCAQDTSEGDKDNSCQHEGGEGTYSGETSVSATVEHELVTANTEAGGSERCTNGSIHRHVQEAFLNQNVCLLPEGWSCGQQIQTCAESGSDERTPDSPFEGSEFRACFAHTDGGGETTLVRLNWYEKYGECKVRVDVYAGPERIQELHDCPAGAPPTPPNPGWGEVVPDL